MTCKFITHFPNDDRSPRSAHQVHHQKINSHAGAAQRRRDDVLNRGVDQTVIHVEETVGKSQQGHGEHQGSVLLANAKVGQRRSSQSSNGGGQHSSVGASANDVVAPSSGNHSSEHSADCVKHSHS